MRTQGIGFIDHFGIRAGRRRRRAGEGKIKAVALTNC
jgi:hypothetical protein